MHPGFASRLKLFRAFELQVQSTQNKKYFVKNHEDISHYSMKNTVRTTYTNSNLFTTKPSVTVTVAVKQSSTPKMPDAEK